MTFSAIVSDIITQMHTQITAQWDADKAGLTSPLDVEVDILTDVPGSSDSLKAVSILIRPPEGPIPLLPSHAEATLTFPIQINISYIDRSDALKLLREAQGIVVDALLSDIQLAGKADGLADPALTLGPVDAIDNGFLIQIINVGVVKVWS